jgi:hypothetical protein
MSFLTASVPGDSESVFGGAAGPFVDAIFCSVMKIHQRFV